jgi:hypothetical protein
LGVAPGGRCARGAVRQVDRLESLQELYELFAHLFPQRLLDTAEAGANSRQRVFTPQVTFWAFVAQVLSPASPCREVVRRVQAWWERTAHEAAGLKRFEQRVLSGSGPAGSGRTGVNLQALELESGSERFRPGALAAGARGQNR